MGPQVEVVAGQQFHLARAGGVPAPGGQVRPGQVVVGPAQHRERAAERLAGPVPVGVHQLEVGPVGRELRDKRFMRIVSLAPEVL